VFGTQRDNGSGYAQQWNFSLQKTFRNVWSVEAGYLGSKLTRLGVPDVNLNQLRVEQLALGAALTEQVANPFFGTIPSNSQLAGPAIARAQLLKPYARFTNVALYRNNVGHSRYHSLQARVERRLSRGVGMSAAYTWSKLMDDAGQVFDAALVSGPVTSFQVADSFNRRLEKDVSTGHIPHQVSASLVWEGPWGVQFAAIARAQAGSPVAVTQAVNLNAFAGFGVQRPDRVPGPGDGGQGPERWFDTSQFLAARAFALGNSSRNPVRGPGYGSLDVMLGKAIALRDALRLELRGEAFNVSNSTRLGNPNGSFGTTAFGTITSAYDPRVLQVAAKVVF
jgi:hypothetical protein